MKGPERKGPGFWPASQPLRARVVLNWLHAGPRFLRYHGFTAGGSGTGRGWILAVISLRLPSVRDNLFRPSWLKVLGLAVAVAAESWKWCSVSCSWIPWQRGEWA